MSYQSPGVYIEEVASGPQPITAASTSVMAVIGRTRMGPRMAPTRVTSWDDFARLFGGTLEEGFTPEAVYGFFANGGPAAYVVRVDPSVPATWRVNDTDGNAAFAVEATAPGAWANDVAVGVAPDLSAGSGAAFRAQVTQPVPIAGTAETPVPVSSSAGIGIGDPVLLVSTAGATSAQVTAVAGGSITVKKAGGTTVNLAKDDVVCAEIQAGATQVTLPAASGIRAGDLLVAITADRTRVEGLVTDVVAVGAGARITLSSALASAIPGVQFADKVVRLRAALAGTPTQDTVALSELTFEAGALAPKTGDLGTGFRALTADGLEATWRANLSNFKFPTVPGGGPLEVEARLRVAIYTEAGISLTNPTTADVDARYPFLPPGTSIAVSDGANTATFAKADNGTINVTGTTTHTFTSATFVMPANASKGVLVRSAQAPETGDHIDFGGTNVLRITGVSAKGGSVYVLGFAETTSLATAAGPVFPVKAFQATVFAPQRFTLTARRGSVAEVYPSLALDPGHPRYYARDGLVNGVSALVVAKARAAGAGAISSTTMPAFAVSTQAGKDEAPRPQDLKDGFKTLEAEPEPAMVISPDVLTFADELVQADLYGAMVTHCEEFRRYAIIDAPDFQGLGDTEDQRLLAWRNTSVASTYAGVFAPHLRILNLDPASKDRYRDVPPSGFVAGVFARTDRERGVHKAPGNERVAGIVGLTQAYTQRRQDLLNPGAVNLIRAFPGRGMRIWGARNATDDAIWRYTSVRRLFNMAEVSVERSTQWVVFEPNTAATWLRIKVSVENFADQLWRAGALAGTKPEQAYRVRVGLGETMTETDIDLGLVITEVALAPAKPAEFVVFRFSHKRLSD